MTRPILKKTFYAACFIVVCAISIVSAQVSIVVNNVGYEKSGTKRAVVQSPSAVAATTFDIVNAADTAIASFSLSEQKTAASWSGNGFRYFKTADFSSFTTDGDGYRVRVGTETSPSFSIGSKILQIKTGADQVSFFNKMRNTDESDRALPVFGSTRTQNIYGGWWDATGDPGKHLSHLSYANYFSPQQIPLVVWALLHAAEVQPDAFGSAARQEAAWGADYLLRSLSPEGYFYMSVFDNWGAGYANGPQPSGSNGTREICAWGDKTGIEELEDGTYNSKGIRSADYQSAMREGAGASIAALARAYKAGISGDSSGARYLAGAKRAYEHLKTNPTKYQDDGRQNIIDYYCGLLAATELYNATEETEYLTEARDWLGKLLDLQDAQGWFYSGKDGNGNNIRPFYHAADEGLPVVAMSRFYQVAANTSEKLNLRAAVRKNLSHYVNITYDRGSNPFEYVKMYRELSPSLGGGETGNGDLARGKPATASREEGGYTAGNAFDGSSTTRWSSYQNGAENNNQWISVDLGEVYNINRVVLNWEGAFGTNYRIDVCTTATPSNWTTAAEITNTSAGRKEHGFNAVKARHVRMFGVERGNEYGGFSLYDFEVYGEEPDINPPSPYNAFFFIPKVNETDYWWQGENARIASMAAAFILGAPIADHTGEMWADTLFGIATAQLDWILGKNPLNLCMMYGYESQGGESYPDYPASRGLANIKGGICNGISSMRSNENNIEFNPYTGEVFWRNWRYIEQWLPHNAWYLIAVSSLSYRIDHPIEPEDLAVKNTGAKRSSPFKVSMTRGRNVRVQLPFAADGHTEIAIYNIQGKKLFKHNVREGASKAAIKIPANIARGTYILNVRSADKKNSASQKITLRQ